MSSRQYNTTSPWPTNVAMAIVAIWLGMLGAAPPSARAAEIRLRPQYRSDAPIVTLGHVANIVTADPKQAEALAAI